ncbi:VWA domain-containing protein [Shewanella algae]|uniref:VWA domain-containing protein n=1 Tax=Shewanella algae TaxID=38313 RepID=UPI000E334EA8|nr:VWA domain-containing protein [Shewanella algae]AXQ15863.1 hypothetical protein BS332_17980 [Shewanella algae]QXP18789.1 VWA domain-containing protein [Shewanella algae]QXP28351.1 VWA domain-containing protein [Shewanella algae]QXP34639.1 VWA domain-containing protein [Shewanella algae]QXP37545.1 VWA domain-containing protein [Shewanella algae]
MQPVSAEVQASLLGARLKQQFSPLIAAYSSLEEQLDSRLSEWQRNCELQLAKEDPFLRHELRLDKWLSQNPSTTDLSEYMIAEYRDFCFAAKVPFDNKFWHQQRQKTWQDAGAIALSKQLLCNEWRKRLDEARIAWQTEILRQLGQQQAGELTDWLKALEQFVLRINSRNKGQSEWLSGLMAKLTSKNVERMIEWCDSLALLYEGLNDLGLEPGLWLDGSLGELTPYCLEEIQQWARYLTTDPGAKKIADILGRMREAEWSEKVSVIKQSRTVRHPVTDINSKEEIIGLRLGKDLEHALPSELALMADPETAILFDLKYIESKLVCFELQGTSFRDDIEHYDVEVTEQAEDAKGPMILCIDTSGSMAGEPEYMAKAMALYLGTKAKAEKRACYVINFSSSIDTFELTQSNGISALTSFLRRAFHGGTDAAPALAHALKMLKQGDYQKADVLVVSDFIMGELPQSLLQEIEQQRDQGNRFNSLVIGSVFMSRRMKTLFDTEWIYDPYSRQVTEIVGFAKQLIEKSVSKTDPGQDSELLN